jgi:hypothetical protein
MSRAHREPLSDSGRSRFFVTMAALLLCITFVGFARTFYLKIFFDTPELPWYVHLHGVVLTVWFTLFLVQTVLITTKRTATHIRLGALTAVAAALLILMTSYMILGADAAGRARGITRQQPIEMLVLGDLSALVAFSILMAVGVSFRHKPAAHKRAMLLASIALVTPAVPRLARLPVFAEVGPALVPAVIVSLILAIFVHDLLTDRRLHRTTIWGSALIVGGFQAANLVARTESGKAFVAAISFGSG